MEKPTICEAEPLSTLTVLQTILTIPGMHGRPEDSVTGPVHIAIFRYGYEFQSRVLRIPDRCGFFWPSLLEVQEEQGAWFACATFYCIMCTVLCTPLGLLSLMYVVRLAIVVFSLTGGFICYAFGLIWMVSVYDGRRNHGLSGHVVSQRRKGLQ